MQDSARLLCFCFYSQVPICQVMYWDVRRLETCHWGPLFQKKWIDMATDNRCPAAVWRVISSNFIPRSGNRHQNLQISVYWGVVFGRMEQCRSHHHMWNGCARLSNALSDAGALPECRHCQCVGGFFGRERTAWYELFLPIPSPFVLHFKRVACCGSRHGSTHHPLPHAPFG